MCGATLAVMYRVYVDEAGDRGMQSTSSRYFVVAAVLVKSDEHDKLLRAELGRIRAELGRPANSLLHFRKMQHASKVKVSSELGALTTVQAITSVIMCKRHLENEKEPGGAAYISSPDPMYLYSLRMLWERLSWYIRDHGGGSSVVTFAQIKGFHVQKINDYRKLLEGMGTNIHWPSFAGNNFAMRGMEERELLQLADSAASSIHAAIEPNRFGDVEDRYLGNLAPKLYRYGARPLTMYGLKVFPPKIAQEGGELARLDAF